MKHKQATGFFFLLPALAFFEYMLVVSNQAALVKNQWQMFYFNVFQYHVYISRGGRFSNVEYVKRQIIAHVSSLLPYHFLLR
jgi:hypothetical protein